ncbi:lysophospholipid acyltransferase family protein [Thermodesulfobacteriota bacterium]
MKINLSSFLQWRLNIYMFRMLGWRITFYYIIMLGKVYFLFNRKEKWRIKQALKTVFPGLQHRSGTESITRDVFRGIFSHYYEKFFNAFSTAETSHLFLKTQIESENLNAIKQGLSGGKGVLLITGHFGGVEFIPGFLAVNHFPVTIIVKFSSDYLRDMSIQKVKKFSIKIIDADETPNIMKAVFNDLRENRIVITQCDEIDEWKPCRRNKTSFLGKEIKIDRTINILSKRCAAAVVFGVIHRNCHHRYKFIATSLEEMAKRFQQPEEMSIGEVVLKFMEKYIYKHPEEWYQWKNYTALDMFSPSDIVTETPVSIPLLKPSLGSIS